MDAVVKKQFKNAMKAAFRDHLHKSLPTTFKDRNQCEWNPGLKISYLKPRMVEFV